MAHVNFRTIWTLAWKKLSFLLVFAIILFAVVLAKNNHDKKVLKDWCNKNVASTQDKIKNREWQAAAKSSNDELKKCDGLLKKMDKVVIYQDLAIASYMTKDKADARDAAEKGLALNKSLTLKERAQIKNQSDVVFALQDIMDGIYFPPDNPKIIEAPRVSR
jgi:hypothetical protein